MADYLYLIVNYNVDLSRCDEKTAMANLQRSIQEVREWLRENFLLLNDKKTEVVIFGRTPLRSNGKLVNRLLAFKMYFGFKIEHVATCRNPVTACLAFPNNTIGRCILK